MAANPIQWAEIEAYRRITLTPLSAWDIRLIRRLDRVVLPILNETPEEPGRELSVRSAGLASRMRAGAAAHNAVMQKRGAT